MTIKKDKKIRIHKKRTRKYLYWIAVCGVNYHEMLDGYEFAYFWKNVTCKNCLKKKNEK